MFYIYALKSLKNSKRYIGYTGKNVEKRLNEHNTGCNKYTKNNGPYKIIYTEKYENKSEAIKREKFLKSRQGRKFLDNLGV